MSLAGELASNKRVPFVGKFSCFFIDEDVTSIGKWGDHKYTFWKHKVKERDYQILITRQNGSKQTIHYYDGKELRDKEFDAMCELVKSHFTTTSSYNKPFKEKSQRFNTVKE